MVPEQRQQTPTAAQPLPQSSSPPPAPQGAAVVNGMRPLTSFFQGRQNTPNSSTKLISNNSLIGTPAVLAVHNNTSGSKSALGVSVLRASAEQRDDDIENSNNFLQRA
jgi:hypothetical protein